MNIWRLVLCEIGYRRLNFVLAVLAVAAAAGCLVAALTVLRLHDGRTEDLLAAQTAATQAEMRKLEDDYRKITRNLGFNVLILPQGQNLADLYADDYAKKDMPEEYADRLANSSVASINHILPSLQQRLFWPEQKRTVILVGVRGEVPILHKDPKKPLLDAVSPGRAVLGFELGAGLKVKKGDQITLLGKSLTVHKIQQQAGTKDDITLWINLAEAQKLLGKEGRINGILALECNCTADRLDVVRKEIAGILPDTQVIEFRSQALTRAEARTRAGKEAVAAVERVRAARAELRAEREQFAGVLVPLVVLGATVWVGLLALGNARDRAAEVGLLRALGVAAPPLYTLFLARAVLVGLLGALLGYGAGVLVGGVWGAALDEGGVAFDPVLAAAVLGAAPLVCALASWLPAAAAARQDPAVILREG